MRTEKPGTAAVCIIIAISIRTDETATDAGKGPCGVTTLCLM